MSYFVHSQGLCESKQVGDDTRIWAFAHVLPKAVIGRECNICDGVFIENEVVLGDRVTVKCGVQIWDGIQIEDDVFIGPNATFTNDLFPRSKQYPESFKKTWVKKGASIGANATLLAGIVIGENAMIGAGSVVTKSVPANAIVMGNPAQITGYVDSQELESSNASVKEVTKVSVVGSVKGVTIHNLPLVKDIRGDLSVGEFSKEVPFIPKRYFIVFDVPNSKVRGEHAHKECHQFLICIKGSCMCLVDDGNTRVEVALDRPNRGLYLPPMTWGVQYKYSADAVLLVFASEFYDGQDYIREYSEFKKIVEASGGKK